MATKEFITIILSELKAYERNNKKHGDNVEKIADSIERNGYITPIIIDEDNVILAGHGRVEALKSKGITEEQVIKVEGLTEKQKADFRITDNKLGDFSERDMKNIDLEVEEFELEEVGKYFDIEFENIYNLDDDFSLPDGDKPEIETMTFTVHRDQKIEIERALSVAKGMGEYGETGNENRNGNAIARVCEIFIMQNTDVS